MISRRNFVHALGGVALAWPRQLRELAREVNSGGGAQDETFWRFVRTHFTIPPDRIYLNNGTLGPSPRVVMEAVEEHGRRVAMTLPPGVDWQDLKGAVAELLGGRADDYVFPRNTTEAVSFVAGGIDVEPGDDVVTTDHEHIGGLEAWRALSARRQVGLRIAKLPVRDARAETLVESVWAEVTPRTRIVSVSHMTFTNGVLLPVGALAARCRQRGIVLVVDGAHPPGMMELDIGSIGAAFYASSPHKWLLAPQGTGLLHVRPPWDVDLWPGVVSGGWDDPSLGAQRLNHLGTFDESRLAGLLAAIRFHQTIGPPRIEARVRFLAERLRTNLASIPGVDLVSPEDPELRLGMVSFTLDAMPALDLQRRLARDGNVRTRVISEYELGWMRLSTHLYTLPDEVDRVAELVDTARRSPAP